MNKFILIFLGVTLMNFAAFAQVNPVSFNSQDVDFKSPRSYTISNIKVQAGYNIDETQVITKSGLQVGSIIKVPGPEITKAIKNLWKENQYKDVEIVAETIKGNQIVLLIKLVPEMVSSGRIDGKGVSRSEHNKFEEAVTMVKENLLLQSF
jgi:outer membrane protein insertion porin family